MSGIIAFAAIEEARERTAARLLDHHVLPAAASPTTTSFPRRTNIFHRLRPCFLPRPEMLRLGEDSLTVQEYDAVRDAGCDELRGVEEGVLGCGEEHLLETTNLSKMINDGGEAQWLGQRTKWIRWCSSG
ncbi:YihA family ribosome biogenesis GTP-binding protein [Sesbania bispinosa]|nr:YihA family ribosome biogenesis GTP-binding protein [Sesbania bispinosa]